MPDANYIVTKYNERVKPAEIKMLKAQIKQLKAQNPTPQ